MIVIRIFWILFLLLHISCLNAQHTVYLIGDAGEDDRPGKALQTLQKQIEKDSESTLIFLGDNSYPQGVNTPSMDTIENPYLHPDAKKLYAQLSILKNYKGNAFFVSGNHDWKAQKKRKALRSIMNESLVIDTYISDSTQIKNRNISESFFIARKFNDSLYFESFDVNNSVCVIMFDSQFFLQKFKGIKRVEKIKRMEMFASQVFSFANEKRQKGYSIVFASHHPLFTNGNHSRFRQPLRFIFNYTPFYFLGKLGIDRWLSQDIDQPLYKKYREIMLKYLIDFKDIYFVAGHDHNLQYITQTDDHHIISGAGSKIKKLRRKSRFKSEFMTDQAEGFAKLIFDESGEVELQFISENNEILFTKRIK